MANNSLSYICQFDCVGVRGFDRYPHGCSSPFSSFCIMTAPIARFDASVCRTKGLFTLGILSTGAVMNFSLRVLNASWHSTVQFHIFSFFVRSLSGRAM